MSQPHIVGEQLCLEAEGIERIPDHGLGSKMQRGRGQQQKSPFRGPQLLQRHPKGAGWIIFLHVIFGTRLYEAGFTVKKNLTLSVI